MQRSKRRLASVILAIGLAVVLAAAEVFRNWGTWQWWPFWLVDFAASTGLFLGAVHVLRGGGHSFLAAAWGFSTAMFYMSFFAHLEGIRTGHGATYGPDGAVSETSLTSLIGAGLVASALGSTLILSAPRQR